LAGLGDPQVLGVDDWADRTRQTYGTRLSDRERRRPLALWPDREAKTVALWWQAHPGVGVMARERCRAYADRARQGAPDALQGADRFHRRQHLAAALDQGCNAHRHTLAAVHAALRQTPMARPADTAAALGPPPSPSRDAFAVLIAYLRLFGSPFLGIAVLNWTARNAIILGNIVGFGAIAALDVWGLFSGARPLTKVFAIIHLLFAVAFIWVG
jgi:Transposase